MTWSRALPAFVALLVVGAVAFGTRDRMTGPGGTSPAVAGAPSRSSSDAAPVDSARGELEAGRPWHASQLLRTAAREGLTLGPAETILLARADLGWKNWDGVVERLAAQSWIDDAEGGEGRLLLARAQEERKEWGSAANSYDRYLRSSHAASNPLLPAIAARHSRVLARAGRTSDARAALDRITAPVVLSWAALAAAEAPADSGRVADVRAFVEKITDAEARLNAWELVPRAILASRDSAAAERAYREAAAVVTNNRRAKAWAVVGDLSRARGDTAAARQAYVSALREGVATPAAARAANGLVTVGLPDAESALLAGRALDRVNDYGPATRAYDAHVRLKGGVAELTQEARLDRARLLTRTPARRDEAIEEFRALSSGTPERIGAVALEAWADLRSEQGRDGDVETLRDWLLERYPTSAEASDVLFFRGDTPHDRNDTRAAAAAYRRLIELAPGSDRAGLAAMRVAQIHLLAGEKARAAETYETYLTRFPSGRRWQEASYWAARLRRELGDRGKSDELLARLRREDPLSYYTVLAADLTGEPFRLDLPPGVEVATPDWLAEGIDRLDLLRAAGLTEGELAEVARLTAQAKGDQGASLALAEALIERDHTIPAINIGFELRRTAPWTVRLAKIIYPWHYQELFEREAHEDGVDPFLTAALARQESAFDPDIVSAADAIGLMQLIEGTASQVARQHGPQGFRKEMLAVPDINVHLGTIHLKELLDENAGDITRFLAGYNAGQQRVVRWRDFSEAKDPLTFTERIPFAETREYVKAVRRNLAIYKALYGSD